LGAFQRLCSVSQSSMNWATLSASSSTPQKSAVVPLPTTFDQPVPTGSMNTRSATSIRLCGLSATPKGGTLEGFTSRSSTTRRGPTTPMCNHSDDEPGPPLNTKSTGRFGSGGPSRR
jgi:hypothetical protein